MNCERLGISQKWPNPKSILKRVEKEGQLAFDKIQDNIHKYINREDFVLSSGYVKKNNATTSEPADLGRFKTDNVLATASQNPKWLVELAQWTRYYQVGIASDFFWHHRFRLFQNRVRDLHMMSMEYASQMMGVMAVLDWREAMLYQGTLAHAALNRGYTLELEYQEEHRRAQAFMLRLFSDWEGTVSHQWPSYAYDEPIYEELLAHWRTPNPSDLVPCLLAACDRHTHQAFKDTTKNYFDFQNFGLARTPIEILFLFRLREWEGLQNPLLDHPLMMHPFDKLPPEQPMPELDIVLQGVLKRAREDWPEFDAVLSIAELKE